MGKVVSITAAKRKPAAKTAPRRKKRAKPTLDPRANIEGRTFEIITESGEGEYSIAHRFRLRLLKKGGLSKNTGALFPGGDQYLCGMLQELISAKKWSAPGYGGVICCEIVSIREIIPDPEEAAAPTPMKKKEDE